MISEDKIESAIKDCSINIQEVIRQIATGQLDQISRWSVYRRTGQIEYICNLLGLWTEKVQNTIEFLDESAGESV